MANVEPQAAAEYAALERLLQAVDQYRAEVKELQQKHKLRPPQAVPRIEVEIPEELKAAVQVLAQALPAPKATLAPEPVAPVVIAALPAPEPIIMPLPVVPTPVTPTAPPPTVPLSNAPTSSPTPPWSSPAIVADASSKMMPPAAPDLIPRPETPPPLQFRPVSPEIPAFSGTAKPASPEIPAPAPVVAKEATQPAPVVPVATSSTSGLFRLDPKPTLVPDAKSALPTAATPANPIPARRPAPVPSVQAETVGSFLRKYRLMGD